MSGYTITGDCRDVLAVLRAEGLTAAALVTDAPYGIDFMGRDWDRRQDNPAFQAEFWRLAYDLLPPGGHVIAFGATRTYHRLACAIENAGFELRDTIYWLYGNGFPKSRDVSKAIDKHAGVEREVVGSVRRWGSNASGGRGGQYANGYQPSFKGAEKFDPVTVAATPEAQQWDGWGTALKPAVEPICLARKPLIGTVAANVLAHSTGALNIDGCRVSYENDAPDPASNPLYRAQNGYANTQASDSGSSSYQLKDGTGERNPHQSGRWPANLVHDGSDEVLEGFPNKTARFFYCAKASKAERDGSNHPTVKPLALMRWLVRLVTPAGGLVLDPFAGTGTTGEAARCEGFPYLLIERDPTYVADIKRRLAA
jgi:site-specific DNA-methyltransferase (adenine-specific)